MRNFSKATRIVVKIGTNTLAKDGGVNTAYVRQVARQISGLMKGGRQVVIVTSGAIGMGVGQLGPGAKPKDMKMRQACAAVGQPLLMQEYRKAFARFGVTVGQVLLTAEVLNHRKTYLNLRNSIETLLGLGVIPVVNENDSVSTDEIGTAFGDNDKLSALVASKIDADLLIMLSDIDGLYDKDPRKSKDAKLIATVYEITAALEQNAGGKGSEYATGGMKTKLAAAKIAASAGCRMVLSHGKVKDVINRIIDGEEIGTLFMPKRKLSNRKRWILNSAAVGTIEVDEGAMRAIRNNKSLLPSGIKGIKGTFDAGSVVMINAEAKAVASLSSSQLRAIAGKHSSEIRKVLGPGTRDVAATPEDIVLVDY